MRKKTLREKKKKVNSDIKKITLGFPFAIKKKKKIDITSQ